MTNSTVRLRVAVRETIERDYTVWLDVPAGSPLIPVPLDSEHRDYAALALDAANAPIETRRTEREAIVDREIVDVGPTIEGGTRVPSAYQNQHSELCLRKLLEIDCYDSVDAYLDGFDVEDRGQDLVADLLQTGGQAVVDDTIDMVEVKLAISPAQPIVLIFQDNGREPGGVEPRRPDQPRHANRRRRQRHDLHRMGPAPRQV